MQTNNYFSCIMAEIMKVILEKDTFSQITILPIYGIRFKESQASKYPKLVKMVANYIAYIKSEYDNYKTAIKRINELNTENIYTNKIKFVSPNRYLVELCWASFNWDLKGLKKALKDGKTMALKIRDYGSINIRDMVIDTYLRYAGMPMFDKNDKYNDDILTRSIALKNYYNKVIAGSKANLYVFSPYSSYIHSGLFVNVSAVKGCKITTLGNGITYYKFHNYRLGLPPTHQEDHQTYSVRRDRALPTELIKKADRMLLKGQMAFMVNPCITW